jgi:D-arabinose 5-phosphate isomerase GutQ
VVICECFPYINDTAENVKSISGEGVRKLLENLREADCLVLAAEGRSKAAMRIGIGQIDKEVKFVEDIDFPGRNLLEAAPTLKKRYDKISLVINTSSGRTTTPTEIARDMARFIAKYDHDKQFTIDVVTSNLDSTIGKIGGEYGTVLHLRGPKSKTKTTDWVLEQGIMNDVYELGSLVLFQKIKEAINEGKDHQWVLNELNKEMETVGSILDQYVDSPVYQSLAEQMSTRGHATIGGRGPARNVAEMTVIRLQHVKRAMGDQAYLSGELAPKPRRGDSLLLVSWSGENKPLSAWQQEYKSSGGATFSIVGNKSTLSEATDSIVIESPTTQFYLRAAFLLSPLPLLLVANLEKNGFGLPPEIMYWYHSVSE